MKVAILLDEDDLRGDHWCVVVRTRIDFVKIFEGSMEMKRIETLG